MGSRQRPAHSGRSDTGGRQARAGESGANAREAAADQRRDEEQTLAEARGDVEEPLRSEEAAGRREGQD
jgi:hypothetical protein